MMSGSCFVLGWILIDVLDNPNKVGSRTANKFGLSLLYEL